MSRRHSRAAARLTLTPGEVNHLLALLERNNRDGIYYAPRDQYWRRHDRIAAKLCPDVARLLNPPATAKEQ